MMAHVVMVSYSRGGMLGLIITAFVTFLLVRKNLVHYAIFGMVFLASLRLAGTEVRERFMTSFTSGDQLDWSSQSRLDLWRDCWDCMLRHPIFGVGPNHWGITAPSYGWPFGKEAHTTWLQTGAELGFIGMLLLISFYGLCGLRLLAIRRSSTTIDPWLSYLACMVIASIAGFAVSAQFVSLAGLEVPYYIVLIGAGALKIASVKASVLVPAAKAGHYIPTYAVPAYH
jgi:O-antigen ligase